MNETEVKDTIISNMILFLLNTLHNNTYTHTQKRYMS